MIGTGIGSAEERTRATTRSDTVVSCGRRLGDVVDVFLSLRNPAYKATMFESFRRIHHRAAAAAASGNNTSDREAAAEVFGQFKKQRGGRGAGAVAVAVRFLRPKSRAEGDYGEVDDDAALESEFTKLSPSSQNQFVCHHIFALEAGETLSIQNLTTTPPCSYYLSALSLSPRSSCAQK